MLLMHANHREDIKEAYAGDIVALAGLKDTTHRRHAVRPAEAGDPGADGIPRSGHRDRGRAEDQGRPGEDGRRRCSRLAAEDPSFRVTTDQESGQTIIKGMGELHLDIMVDRMKREFKVDANVGAPQVAYRETITREIDASTTPTRSRPAARASSPASSSSSSRAGAGNGLRVRVEGRRRHGAEGIHPGRREGLRVGADVGSADRLPDDRLQGRR